jgi:dCMP deaminase
MQGATIYIEGYNADGSLASGKPCLLCRRMLRNAMIAEAVYREPDGTIVRIAPKDIVD